MTVLNKIILTPENLPGLSPLFQKGVQVEIETGDSLKSLLCDQWGLPSDYVMGRISTLFLDGKPVDDLETATVREGATLALSSAMPGLVGAVMRRGGYYAGIRSAITYQEGEAPAGHRRGKITVKLFNLLISEMGDLLLEQGFWASRSDVEALLPDELGQIADDRDQKVFLTTHTV